MAEIFRLDDVADAYEKVATGKFRFRAVITDLGLRYSLAHSIHCNCSKFNQTLRK